MKIIVVGGGPGGLFFARLMKRARPHAEIQVFEQNRADATFGFGVGVGGASLGRIGRYDGEVQRDLEAAMVFSNTQKIHLNGAERVLEYGARGGQLARIEILRVLQRASAEVGVEVEHERRIDDVAALDADLVVGADGINSLVRQHHGAALGASVYHLGNHFAWYGVDAPIKPSCLCFRRVGEAHYVAHYYRYTPTRTTFVAECDAETWALAGLDHMTDAERRQHFEQVFAPELGGRPLVENNSIWRNFPVTTVERWFVGNTVLIGDALRSAHFSIGSGTRLAMEDALALFDAFQAEGDDVGAALEHFVALRKPVREKFASAAERSFLWYERMRETMRQPLDDFIYDFLTRTGRIDDERLRHFCPGFFAHYFGTARAG